MANEDHVKYRETLLNSYLSISNSTSSLKDIAYAKLIYLILYVENKLLNIDELLCACSGFLDIIGIPEESMVNALKLLEIKKIVIKEGYKWQLSSVHKKEIEKQLQYSKQVTKNICKKYFPNALNETDLLSWFNKVNEKYFGAFADKLITLFNKKEKLIVDVETVLLPIIKEFNFDIKKDELIQGYKEFLISEEREEEDKIWDLMQSIFSAKMVSADISPDLLNIEKFKNATVFFDTNVLFAATLQINKKLLRAMNSFGEVANLLGMKLCVADFTLDEYKKVCESQKEQAYKLWDSYSMEVLKKANHKDDFFKNLIELGCEKTEDIDRFFGMIAEPVKQVGEAKICIMNEKDYGSINYNEKNDARLYSEISNIWNEFRGKFKPEETTIHDVLLTKLVTRLSAKERVFVLTLDISMETLSLRHTNEKDDLKWRSVFSLIQILALNGGGPQFDSKKLASFIKIFIEQEEIGKDSSYDKRDLLVLTELSDRISELPDTKVRL